MHAAMFGIVAAVTLAAGGASAATVILNEDGLVSGATEVVIDGSIYSVDIGRLGTCSDVFDGCDEQSDFTFTDAASAGAATIAFRDQVAIGAYFSAGSFVGSEGRADSPLQVLTPYALPEPDGGGYDLISVAALDF